LGELAPLRQPHSKFREGREIQNGPPSITLSALSRDTYGIRGQRCPLTALSLAVLFLLIRKPLLLLLVLLSLLLIATSARFQNPAVEARSTNHLFGL